MLNLGKTVFQTFDQFNPLLEDLREVNFTLFMRMVSKRAVCLAH